jgi:hypothetical protein
MPVKHGHLSTKLCDVTSQGETVILKIHVFWDLRLCQLVNVTDVSGKNTAPFSKVRRPKEVAGL